MTEQQQPEQTKQPIDNIVIEPPPQAAAQPKIEAQKIPEVLPAQYTEPLPVVTHSSFSALTDPKALDHLIKVATIFSKSQMIPVAYQDKPANCFVACHSALTLNVDPLIFMQHSYIVHGKPAIEGKFAIALLQSRGKYAGGVRFRYEGEGDERKCVAYGERSDTGEIDECEVSVKMAKAEGWWHKKDSKWPTLTDQMLAYRAGAFFARRFDPGILMGMQTVEEVWDVDGADGRRSRQPRSGRKVMRKLGATLQAQKRTKEAVKAGRGYRYSKAKIQELQGKMKAEDWADLMAVAQEDYGAIEHGEVVFTFKPIEGWADALIPHEMRK